MSGNERLTVMRHVLRQDGQVTSRNVTLSIGCRAMISLVLCLAVDGPCFADGPTFEASTAERLRSGDLVHRVTSPWQAGETQIRVLLPAQWELASGSEKNALRLLLVLPVEAGAGTHWGDGLAEIRKLDLHNRFHLICVAPTFSHLPWYADHPTDATIQQETYLLKGVVPFVSQTYGVGKSADDRFLLGFSKSGWGAFSLLLRHPDVFGKAVAWDAPLMMPASGEYGSGPVFGNQENFRNYQVSELLKTAGKQLGSRPRLIHIGYGNFSKHHTEFETLLNGLDIPHVYQHGPQRKHAWGSGWIEDGIPLMLGATK